MIKSLKAAVELSATGNGILSLCLFYLTNLTVSDMQMAVLELQWGHAQDTRSLCKVSVLHKHSTMDPNLSVDASSQRAKGPLM